MNPDADFEDSEITKDAREALARYSNDWRRELLVRANMYSDSRGSTRVTRSDVLNAALSLDLEDSGREDSKLAFRIRLVALVTGFLILAVALVSYIWSSGSDQVSAPVAAVVGAAVGSTATYVSLLVSMRTTPRVREHPVASLAQQKRAAMVELLSRWQEIERMLTSGLHGDERDKSSRRGLTWTVREYLDSGRISESQHQMIREVLRVRNNVVHGTEEYTVEELAQALRHAEKVKRELSAIGLTGAIDE